MKKPYIKPAVVVEHFALTQAIASCTGYIINSMDRNCIIGSPLPHEWWSLAQQGVFIQDAERSSCIRFINYGDEYSNVCFHTNASPAFSS